MTLLEISVIALIATIGLTDGSSLKPEEEIDVEYRPWIYDNDNATVWVSLKSMGITTVTLHFRLNIPNIKWLILDNNRINAVSVNAFQNFPDLTYLSLAGNDIRIIEFDKLGNLEKLEVLDLDGNRNLQDDLPTNWSLLSTFGKLRRLYARNCRINSFKLPTNMANLSRLYLSYNQLRTFYTEEESALTSLYLNNNWLTYVSLSQFKSLVYMDVSSNQLTKILRQSVLTPSYFARHPDYLSAENRALYLEDALALKYLLVSSNRLSLIGSDAFKETKALVHVNLTDNRIIEIYRGTFNDLPYLEDILLDSNIISQISHGAFVNLPNLKTISLKNNLIDDIDEDAFADLNSSANEIHLFLDNNRIRTLTRGSFKGMKGLRHIGLSNNRITTIASQTFVDLPNLDSIVIENQISDENSRDRVYSLYTTIDPFWTERKGFIESDAFVNLTSITSITITGNSFTDIEAKAFHGLPKLISLNLSRNQIATLSPEAFYDLPAIEDLSLAHNALSQIYPDTFPKRVKRLNLAKNKLCPEFSCWHIEELDQLEEIDVSGIIERFKLQDFAGCRENLTVIVIKDEESTSLTPRLGNF